MKEELESIIGFKRVKVIKNEEECLEAEKGSLFVEFHSLERSEKAMKKLKRRNMIKILWFMLMRLCISYNCFNI